MTKLAIHLSTICRWLPDFNQPSDMVTQTRTVGPQQLQIMTTSDNLLSHVRNGTNPPLTTERFVMSQDTEVLGFSRMTLNYCEIEDWLNSPLVTNRADAHGRPGRHLSTGKTYGIPDGMAYHITAKSPWRLETIEQRQRTRREPPLN